MKLKRPITTGKMKIYGGTEIPLAGKTIIFTEHKRHGSLSDRYLAEIDCGTDSQIAPILYFVKTYHIAENCSGPASCEINKNEIAIQDYVRQWGE